MNTLSNEKIYGFMKTAMNAAAVRHQVISANLANIDTPGYKARDMDFEKVLQDYEDQENMLPDERRDVNRPSTGRKALDFHDYMVDMNESAITERFDGNNVNLDQEVSKLALTRGRFNIATQFINTRVRLINDLIR